MARRGVLPTLQGLILGAVLAAPAHAAGMSRNDQAMLAAPIPQPVPRRPAFTIAVLGDSFADSLAEGLRQTFGGEPEVVILPDTHAAAGLADATRFDWSAAVRTLLAGKHVDAAAIMVGGGGDKRPLPDGTGSAEPGSSRWRILYGDRIAALIGQFKDNGVPVLWVGLPIVAGEQAAADFAVRNEIARARASAAGATYVDSWDAFADAAGRFGASGPDRQGRIVRLRSADGRGFTKAGATKLASFIEPALRRLRTAALAAAATTTDVVLPPGPDLDLDVNDEIRRDLGLPTLAPPPKPSAATPTPAIVLTAPPLSPEGALAAASIGPAPVSGTTDSLAQRTLMEGRPLPPKIGRIDDFSWPRQ